MGDPNPLPGGTPLSNPAFRRIWVGVTLSAAGDGASWIALVALCLGPAGANLPTLVVLYTAPVAVGGLAAGWVLDRFDRRWSIIIDSLIRCAAFASIPIGMLAGTPAPIQLYAVAALYGLLKMVGLAGFPALIPSLVPHHQLDRANALEGMSFGLASLCGAALGGLGVATVGAGTVVAFDAASYLALAITLLSVPELSRAVRPSAGARDRRGGIGDIAKLVVTHPVLRTTTIMFALFNVGDGCLLVFLPHRATDLGLGRGGYGYLVAATTAGGLLASALLARRGWRWQLRGSIVVAQAAATTSVLALVLRSAVTTVAALVLLGLFTTPMTAWAQTLRMRIAPPEGHGRLFALLRTAMQATAPLGAGLAALSARAGGTTVTLLTVVAVMGFPVLLLGPGLVGGSPEKAVTKVVS